MELIKALKICLELAEQNIINDADMPLEMLDQWNAVQTLRMHIEELENPSPIILISSPFEKHTVSNVPITLYCMSDSLEPNVIQLSCDPKRVAELLNQGK